MKATTPLKENTSKNQDARCCDELLWSPPQPYFAKLRTRFHLCLPVTHMKGTWGSNHERWRHLLMTNSGRNVWRTVQNSSVTHRLSQACRLHKQCGQDWGATKTLSQMWRGMSVGHSGPASHCLVLSLVVPLIKTHPSCCPYFQVLQFQVSSGNHSLETPNENFWK